MTNLHQGLNHQATIIAVAPMIGLLGTLDGVIASFPGIVGETTVATFRCYYATRFATVLLPLAYSLVLTIFTKWAHTYLSHQADILQSQTLPPPREVQ